VVSTIQEKRLELPPVYIIVRRQCL